MITSGGLTGRLASLEKRGLVERIQDPFDGRSQLVGLTPNGFDKVQSAIIEDMRTERELLDGLTQDEKDALAKMLWKLALSLESKGL